MCSRMSRTYPASPTLLLLHGFPASSFMYRHLMRTLADRFHLVAPDYPGFGNSEAPNPDEWPYTFDHLTDTIEALVDHLGPSRYGLFMQDYRSPRRLPARAPPSAGRRLPRHPERQRLRGRVHRRLGRTPPRPLAQPHPRDRTAAPNLPRTRRRQMDLYRRHHPERISPDNWNLDLAVLARPNTRRINLDLFYDYRTNPEQYPAWHQYLRRHRPPTLIVWGAQDPIFTPEGGEAFVRDVPDAELHLLDTGHFALEDHEDEIAGLIRAFYTTRVNRTVNTAA
jgi:pimeloyl-ACP methyl ester carboxylesterase